MMTKISYHGYRFPPMIIQQAIWLYPRFTLSFRDVKDLLAERGITVSDGSYKAPQNVISTARSAATTRTQCAVDF